MHQIRCVIYASSQVKKTPSRQLNYVMQGNGVVPCVRGVLGAPQPILYRIVPHRIAAIRWVKLVS